MGIWHIRFVSTRPFEKNMVKKTMETKTIGNSVMRIKLELSMGMTRAARWNSQPMAFDSLFEVPSSIKQTIGPQSFYMVVFARRGDCDWNCGKNTSLDNVSNLKQWSMNPMKEEMRMQTEQKAWKLLFLFKPLTHLCRGSKKDRFSSDMYV